LIEATDIDGSKTVTFAPNGFVGTLATAVGAEVHGLVVAEAVATPTESRTGTTHPTSSAARANREPTALLTSLPAELMDMRCDSSCR
jgi:hypothetical protein